MIRNPERHRREEDDRPEPGRPADGQAGLLVGPGDRVEHGDQHEHQGDRDHEPGEEQVATAGDRLLGHGQGHITKHGRTQHERTDEQDPAERRATQDEHDHPGERVQADPLGGESEAEQETDQREDQPEGPGSAPAPRPQWGEQGIGGHDEQPDVDIIHGDPRLDEEHPIGQRQQRRQHRDVAPSEEQPDEQEQERSHERPGEHAGQAPGEGMVADVDRAQ